MFIENRHKKKECEKLLKELFIYFASDFRKSTIGLYKSELELISPTSIRTLKRYFEEINECTENKAIKKFRIHRVSNTDDYYIETKGINYDVGQSSPIFSTKHIERLHRCMWLMNQLYGYTNGNDYSSAEYVAIKKQIYDYYKNIIMGGKSISRRTFERDYSAVIYIFDMNGIAIRE